MNFSWIKMFQRRVAYHSHLFLFAMIKFSKLLCMVFTSSLERHVLSYFFLMPRHYVIWCAVVMLGCRADYWTLLQGFSFIPFCFGVSKNSILVGCIDRKCSGENFGSCFVLFGLVVSCCETLSAVVRLSFSLVGIFSLGFYPPVRLEVVSGQ